MLIFSIECKDPLYNNLRRTIACFPPSSTVIVSFSWMRMSEACMQSKLYPIQERNHKTFVINVVIEYKVKLDIRDIYLDMRNSERMSTVSCRSVT